MTVVVGVNVSATKDFDVDNVREVRRFAVPSAMVISRREAMSQKGAAYGYDYGRGKIDESKGIFDGIYFFFRSDKFD